jgi:RimJ/RimL family protein N-acetyltransferase
MYGWGMEPLKESQIDDWMGESTRVVLMVQDLHTKSIVGMVNFYDIDREKNIADWGIVIDPSFAGKGYGQAAGKSSI